MKVAILGGTGGMGRWFASYFRGKAFDVILSGRFPEKTATVARELGVGYAASDDVAVRDADMVVVSTPIEVTATIIRAVASHMRKGAILYDLASVKGDVIEALTQAAALGLRALSVHPLFGPGAPSMQGQRVLLIPVAAGHQVVNELAQLFQGDGGITHVLASGDVHDKMMALTLGLPHFLNILFARVLAGVDIRDVKTFAGTTFTLQLLLAESVLSQDPHLYYAIQSQNPAFTDLLTAIRMSLDELVSAVMRKDNPRFITLFQDAATALAQDPGFSTAYQRFYKALNASH